MQAADSWRRVIESAPVWEALPAALRDDTKLALGQLAWEAGCKPRRRAAATILTGRWPVLIANGNLIRLRNTEGPRRGASK